MSNNSFLRSFILSYLKSCKRLIVFTRTDNTNNRINSWYYSSYWSYIFCQEFFFKKKEKYEKHSKGLVKALKKWIDYLRFPYCEYVGGSLNVYDYNTIDEIPLLKQAKDHLDKRYHHILEMHDDTIQNCTQLCRKIKEIINAKDKQSFENIIINKINSACPKLKMTYEKNFIESNTYIAPYIFKTIFKNQPINVNELDTNNNNKLVYQGIIIFAQGEKLDMEKLKQVILELISNNEIKKLIEEYHTLHKELENKSESFKKEITDLYNLVNGGKQLDKPKDCDICKSF